ncbi:uncharacterized protein JCM6883_000807 [Sporobolomyces salmoneus]|uniref:uncharacterized protein n=1 Tax=Sporobolomyces salmoneus TaxID=183962 RepID=UPI00316E63F4
MIISRMSLMPIDGISTLNSLNLLLTRHLNDSFDPDLDMYQESHAFGAFHLALRGFSTARIWATDEIESKSESNGEEQEGEGKKLGEGEYGWNRLLGISREGIKVIQARVKAGCILSNQALSRESTHREGGGRGEALKIGLSSIGGKGATLGFWNCQASGFVEVRITREDIADALGTREGEEEEEGDAIITTFTFSFSSSSTDTTPTELQLSLVQTILPERTVRIATIIELDELESRKGRKVKVGCLGLRDKFVGSEAVKKVEVIERREGKRDKQKKESIEQGSLAPAPAPSTSESVSSSFPSPPPSSSHLPFLVTYFANLFLPQTSVSTASSRRQTPSADLSSFFRSFLQRPFSTLSNEIRGILTFGIAMIVWAFKTRQLRRIGDETVIESSTTREQEQSQKEELGATSTEKEDEPQSTRAITLQIELEFISPQVAFYFSPALSCPSDIEFRLDGAVIEEEYVKAREEGIVEVDFEGFWRENGKRIKLGSRSWIIDVTYRDQPSGRA